MVVVMRFEDAVGSMVLISRVVVVATVLMAVA